jgi:hypothetical protein
MLGESNRDGAGLISPKLDRSDRNAMEVRSTVDQLAGVGVRGQWLARGVVDSVGAVGSGREVSRLCGLIETTSGG